MNFGNITPSTQRRCISYDDVRKYVFFKVSPQSHERNPPEIFLPHREAIKSIRHGNELLKSDLAWEARESRFITNPSAAAEIQKLQDQADIYAKKTEQVCILRRVSRSDAQ